MIGRKKKALFNQIKDRIWKRIQSWKGKHLSKAGREVLIKSVAQSIPTYCMGVFVNTHLSRRRDPKDVELLLVGVKQTKKQRHPLVKLGEIIYEKRIRRNGISAHLWL
uniref:Uncharacterized protein n=1 Tax=Cajanus cajan TaxID=3821 RepID=A0A151REK4_CAJCA|nr:hypothetical protein KK1_037735 [Cajanus cajan]